MVQSAPNEFESNNHNPLYLKFSPVRLSRMLSRMPICIPVTLALAQR